jgi:hypothetical protein
MTEKNERLEILDMIQRGRISPEEGMKLIKAIDESDEILNEEYLAAKSKYEGSPDGPALDTSYPDPILENPEEWRKWWFIPFGIGAGITVLGAGLMYWAWSVKGYGVGFFLAWIPFFIGISILVLGWNSQTGPWLHLRIQQKPGESPETIRISLPLPIRFTAWVLRTFGEYITGLKDSGLDEIILALGDKTKQDAPLSIDVHDDEDGEQVRIYIG